MPCLSASGAALPGLAVCPFGHTDHAVCCTARSLPPRRSAKVLASAAHDTPRRLPATNSGRRGDSNREHGDAYLEDENADRDAASGDAPRDRGSAPGAAAAPDASSRTARRCRFYGQINKGILHYDDGIDTESYYVDRQRQLEHARRLEYDQAFGDWTFENVNEFTYAPYSTGNINILDDSPTSDDYELTNANIRKIDFTLANDRYGKFWLGQGSMATDGIARDRPLRHRRHRLFQRRRIPPAAQIIRFSDPTLSFDDNPQIGQASPANYDGGRRVRLRYDTPAFSGFSVAFAFGQRPAVGDEDDARHQPVRRRADLCQRAYDELRGRRPAIGYYCERATTPRSGPARSRRCTPRPAST